MGKYFAANGAPLTDEQAQKYGDFIETFCDRDGSIEPELLLTYMGDDALSDWFYETDQEAAYKWRLDKARQLLRYIYVEGRDPDGNVFRHRAFYPVTIEVETTDSEGVVKSFKKRAYRETVKILRISEQREEVFEDVLKRFREMRSKYRHFKELKEVFEAIDNL